jgi:hypothetical protein
MPLAFSSEILNIFRITMPFPIPFRRPMTR